MANDVRLRVYDTVMEAEEVEHQLARGGIAGVRPYRPPHRSRAGVDHSADGARCVRRAAVQVD